MSQVTLETIRPLIAKQEQRGGTVHVTFRCPTTGRTVDASAGIPRAQAAGAMASHTVRRSIFYSLQRIVYQIMRSIFGYGIAGRLGQDLGRQAMRSVEEKTRYSKDQIDAATLDAFRRVENQFRWEATAEGGGRWVAAQ